MDQGTPVTIGPTVAPWAPCLARLVVLRSVEGEEAKRQGPKERLGPGDAAWMTRGLFHLIHRKEVVGASIWPVEIKRRRNLGRWTPGIFVMMAVSWERDCRPRLVSFDLTRREAEWEETPPLGANRPGAFFGEEVESWVCPLKRGRRACELPLLNHLRPLHLSLRSERHGRCFFIWFCLRESVAAIDSHNHGTG